MSSRDNNTGAMLGTQPPDGTVDIPINQAGSIPPNDVRPPNDDSVRPAPAGRARAQSSTFNFPMRNSPQMLSAPTGGLQRPRKKVYIKPGFSQMDWMRLTTSGEDLRGVEGLQMLTMEDVAKHNKRDDCWMVICGKVYNVTRYLDFHPGGRGQLMRAAGKDGTKLFLETHSWVNFDAMLKECFVGLLANRQVA